MATSSYDNALARLLAHEGGYSNHPADPGGPTNFGITLADYRKYLKPGATAADVRTMTVEEAKSIYRGKYWAAMRCGELPAGVDYAVFDYGVNSGIGRAGKVLRRVLKLTDDSSAVTDTVVAAAGAAEARTLVNAICDERLRFLQSLKTWSVFGKGWGRRVAEVRIAALALAAGASAPIAAPLPAQGRGAVSASRPAQQASVAAGAVASAVIAGQAHQAGASLSTAICILFAAAVLGSAGWLLWRRRERVRQEAVVDVLANSQRSFAMWERIKTWFKSSLTILWARVQVLVGLAVASLLALAQDPNIVGALQSLLQPKLIPYYVIGVGVLTELARRRTLKS